MAKPKPQPEPFIILEDVFTPETRPELLERLRTEAQEARRKSSEPPSNQTENRPVSSVPSKSLPYVGPMRRGDSPTPVPNANKASASPTPLNSNNLSWIQQMQDPHAMRALWKNPNFRKGATNILAFAAFLVIVFLFVTLGEDPPEANEQQAALIPASDEAESLPESPQVEETISETPEKAPALVPVEKPATSQVTVQVESPNRVTIEIDGDVYPNTEKVTLPLTPGSHHLKISKDGYETYHSTIEVADIAQQTLPAVALVSLAPPVKTEAAPAQIQVVSTPAKAAPNPSPEPANMPAYGIELNEAEQRSLASALDKILNTDWNADRETAVSDAKTHLQVWGPFTKWDPRLEHAYGLALWHHGETRLAKQALLAAVKREKKRFGQTVPYYPLYRDKIRLESVTNDEELAAEDLLDLIQDTTKVMERYPQAARDEAIQNADFTGRMLAFLEGPSKAKLAADVNLRLLHSRIDTTFRDEELRGIYQTARAEVQEQYLEELQTASAQSQARDAKERELQESGELGRTRIRSKDNHVRGRYLRSDHNAQTVTPYRIPDVTSAFATDRGLVGVSRGPAFVPFNNLLFSSGPAVSKSYVSNRTTNTTRLLDKVENEKLPNITFRRPHSLNTYMPEELERKRRNLLESATLADGN